MNHGSERRVISTRLPFAKSGGTSHRPKKLAVSDLGCADVPGLVGEQPKGQPVLKNGRRHLPHSDKPRRLNFGTKSECHRWIPLLRE